MPDRMSAKESADAVAGVRLVLLLARTKIGAGIPLLIWSCWHYAANMAMTLERKIRLPYSN
jgi:hypothetical protein